MSIAPELALTKSLTSQQRSFINHVSEGLDVSRCAELAGYAPEHTKAIAWQLLQQPAIIAAVHLETARKLATAAPAAVRVLREFVADEQCDKRIRLAAANSILNRAGHIAPKAAEQGRAGETPLNEMTMGELRTLADKLEGEIAGRAKEVSSAKAAPRAPQAIEDII